MKNGFTIVPASLDIPQTDPRAGTTVFEKVNSVNLAAVVEDLHENDLQDGKLWADRSGDLPLWIVRCDETGTIRYLWFEWL